MTEKKRLHESAGKDAGGADQSAHERFKSLARKLVRVPRKEIEQEQRRYESEKKPRKPKS